MAEQRERLERALRGCADTGVPDPVDLWPTIRERVSGDRTEEERATDEVAGRSLSAANAPLAVVLAVVSLVILGAVVYVAARPLQEPSRHEPATEKQVGQSQEVHSEDTLSGLKTRLDQTKTGDGARVTLRWAYADERFVAVGLETQQSQRPDSVVFEPSLIDDTVGDEAKLPPYVRVTDASGQDFDTVGGGTLLGPRRTGARAAFDAPEGLVAGREHVFHLTVPLYESGRSGVQGERPDAGPFVFRFEVPVRPAPAIEVGQEVEEKGITVTLERVIDSPLMPQAVVCFEPPDDEHSWMPFLTYDRSSEEEVGSAPRELGDGCWSLQMVASGDRSSVTVANLVGMPTGPSDIDEAGTVTPKTIHGPWRFDVPERPG